MKLQSQTTVVSAFFILAITLCSQGQAQSKSDSITAATVNGLPVPQAWIDQVVRNNTLKGAQDTSDLRKSIKEELIGREVLADQGDVQQYKPSLIVVQTEDEAKLILKQLQSGQAFEKLAQAKSIDQSKSAGGDLGWILPSQIATAISNVMVNLTKGRS